MFDEIDLGRTVFTEEHRIFRNQVRESSPPRRAPAIHRSAEFTLERVRKPDLLLFDAVAGSHAFGTAVEGSDEDRRGVFAAPPGFLYRVSKHGHPLSLCLLFALLLISIHLSSIPFYCGQQTVSGVQNPPERRRIEGRMDHFPANPDQSASGGMRNGSFCCLFSGDCSDPFISFCAEKSSFNLSFKKLFSLDLPFYSFLFSVFHFMVIPLPFQSAHLRPLVTDEAPEKAQFKAKSVS